MSIIETERIESNVGQAIQMAAKVHQDQRDKAGEHYILHVLAVMEMVRERYATHHRRDVLMIVAVLHDSLEDFEGTPMERQHFANDIYSYFGSDVSSALDALTHRQYETYDEYIERVARYWIARVVKIADLTHNMDPRRIPASQIVDKDFARWDKYRKALIRLERK